MRTAFVQVLRPLAAVALPVCLLMGAMAPDLISFVYGAQWAPAAPVLRWLALLAAMRIFFELAYDYLVVNKRSAAILRLQLVWIIALVPALWLGIERGGIEGAAAAMVVVTAVVSLPMYLFELRRGGIGPRKIGAAVAVPCVAAAGAATLAALLARSISGSFAALSFAAAVGLVCTGLVVWSHRDDLRLWRHSGDGGGGPATEEAAA